MWTPERVDRLEFLWREGWSCSQIAAEIGGVTRNAVIGKVHRLGLAGRVTVHALQKEKKPRPEPKRPRGRPREVSANPPRLISIEPHPEILPPAREIIEPAGEGVTLVDHRIGFECAWILTGRSETRFCGADVIPGTSWCPWHARIAWAPKERKRAHVD